MKTLLSLFRPVLLSPADDLGTSTTGAAVTADATPAPATEPTVTSSEPTETPEPATEPAPAQEDTFTWGLEEDGEGGEPTPTEPEGAEEFAPDWDAHPVPEEIRGPLTEIGEESGLKSDAYMTLVDKLDKMLVEQQSQVLRAEGQALKELWGKDFDANFKTASAAMRDFAKSINVDPASFANSFPPTKANMQLMHRLAQLQSGSSHVEGQKQADKAWFGDPNNDLYQAWQDPSHPKHREARARRVNDNLAN